MPLFAPHFFKPVESENLFSNNDFSDLGRLIDEVRNATEHDETRIEK